MVTFKSRVNHFEKQMSISSKLFSEFLSLSLSGLIDDFVRNEKKKKEDLPENVLGRFCFPTKCLVIMVKVMMVAS